MKLKIDPEFRDKIPPLTESEFKQLEENILSDGIVREPIITWNNTIIDGHHRWKIIQNHPEIPYKVTRMIFPDKWAAIVWMCKNQLGKRNLTDEQKSYLIGKEYEAMKKSIGEHKGNQHTNLECGQSDAIPNRTRDIVAQNHSIGTKTVERAAQFAKGLDAAESVSPGFKDSILSGAVKAPKSTIAQIAKLDEPEQKKAVKAIQRGEKVRVSQKPEAPSTETAHDSEYNFDDLKMELDCVVGVFERNFKSTLTVHSTMIADERGKEKVIAALSEAEAAIRKLKGLIL